MSIGKGWLAVAGMVLGVVVAAGASAQAPVPAEPAPAPAPAKQFEIIAPGPTPREASRVPEADFYHEDQRVPYDPAFIAPLTGTTRGGTKYGASVWTSPQTPVGSLASQVYQQNNGWFGFGITFMWDAFSGPAPRTPRR